MTPRRENVGMGEIRSFRGPTEYTCPGLGSSIAVCMFDPLTNVSVVAHILLPQSFSAKTREEPGKFADTAIPEVCRQIELLGGRVSDSMAAYAGGAQVFQFGASDKSRLDIGTRNAEAVRRHLEAAGVKIAGCDVGGTSGRTLLFSTVDGCVRIRTFVHGEKELVNLRDQTRRAA